MPQLGQHGGLIAGAGADLQRAATRREAQQVGHQGDDIGLRYRLSVTDRQWAISIGEVAQVRGDKGITRRATHGIKHILAQHNWRGAAAYFARDRFDDTYRIKAIS